MKFNAVHVCASAIVMASVLFASHPSAGLIACNQISTTKNYMQISDAYVSSCVDAGVGNINGNAQTDDLLLANPGSGLVGINGGSFVQLTKTSSKTTGTFSLDPNLWNTWNDLLIGFKFGTGSKPDQWFVYALNDLVSSGYWIFNNVFGIGGGISHVQLYASGPRTVPEPSTLSLVGAGLLGTALVRRRAKRLV